ncbi:MAG: NTP transferase domain-containing protein, partial [Deltaproteobacteria bacterium]|nr:NTP transferase domain-containing protein [Deltaproteobacteria bacterium]
MAVVVLIPARLGSSRLPGKPLVPIAGQTMIQRVFQQAVRAQGIDKVVVATDDAKIAHVVESFGGQAIMTSPDHACGTDRLAEAARLLDLAGD